MILNQDLIDTFSLRNSYMTSINDHGYDSPPFRRDVREGEK